MPGEEQEAMLGKEARCSSCAESWRGQKSSRGVSSSASSCSSLVGTQVPAVSDTRWSPTLGLGKSQAGFVVAAMHCCSHLHQPVANPPCIPWPGCSNYCASRYFLPHATNKNYKGLLKAVLRLAMEPLSADDAKEVEHAAAGEGQAKAGGGGAVIAG